MDDGRVNRHMITIPLKGIGSSKKFGSVFEINHEKGKAPNLAQARSSRPVQVDVTFIKDSQEKMLEIEIQLVNHPFLQ